MFKKIALIAILAIVLALISEWSLAETINIPVRGLAVIYPSNADPVLDHGLRLLVKFNLPDSLSTKRILFAEVCSPLPLFQFRDTTFSFEFFAITRSWDENNVEWNSPWVNLGGDVDSMQSFTRFFAVGDDSLHLDLTSLTKDWLQQGRSNYGFLITTNFLNRRGLRFNFNSILPQIRSALFLQIRFDNAPISY